MCPYNLRVWLVVKIWTRAVAFSLGPMTLLFICWHWDNQICFRIQFGLDLCANLPRNQEVILTDNPNKPVPSCSSRCSLVSENSSWEVTGRVSPHLSEPDWLPYSHSYRLLPSHSLTPAEGLREDKERKMRRVVSLWERMNKQIEEIKRERKAEVACEDVWTILSKHSNQNAILIRTSGCQLLSSIIFLMFFLKQT